MNTKVCSKCSAEKPITEFYLDTQKGNPTSWCKSCLTVTGLNWTKYRQFVQKHWQLTRKQFTAMPKALRSQRTAIARKYYSDAPIVPAAPDLPEGRSARSRGKMEPLPPLVPEGWVYIISNPSVYPPVMKIGKTFPNGLKDRYGESKRWGRSDLLHKEWFGDAVLAEKRVHQTLAQYRINEPNAGEELFEVSFETALAATKALKTLMGKEHGTGKAQEMEEQAISELDGLAPVL